MIYCPWLLVRSIRCGQNTAVMRKFEYKEFNIVRSERRVTVGIDEDERVYH